jgi:hypothetical protein
VPVDELVGDLPHCAELVPFVLAELPHTFTSTVPSTQSTGEELPVVDPDDPALVPFVLSTDTAVFLTLTGASTGTHTALCIGGSV